MTWIKSSLSFSNGNCVEVEVQQDGSVKMRDSDHPETVLHFTDEEWDCFLDGARNGEFDHFAQGGNKCLCGYPGTSADDLETHIAASMHAGPEHHGYGRR